MDLLVRKTSETHNYLLPTLRDASVVHGVQRLAQILAHHDRAIDRKLQIAQIVVHRVDDTLHTIDFLSNVKADVKVMCNFSL